MRNDRLKIVGNLFYLLKQQRMVLIGFTLIITMASFLEALGIGMLYPIINILEGEAKKLDYVKHVNAFFHTSIPADQFVTMLFVIVSTIFLIRGVFFILTFYLQYKLSESLKTNWQIRVFSRYLSEKYDYFIDHQTGDLIQRQMTHTEMAGNAIVYFCQTSSHLITAIFLFITLCIISFKWAFFSAIFMLLITSFYLFISKLKVYVASKEHAKLQEEAYSITSEVIAGIRQVKVFLAEDFFKRRFSNAVIKKAQIAIRNSTMGQSPIPIMQTIVLIGIVLGLFVVTNNREGMKGLLPLVSVFGGAIYRISGSIAGINSSFMQIAHLLPSINIVSNLLRSERPYRINPKIECFSSLKFEKVCFSYHEKGFRLFDIDLDFKKGKFYGIVGISGSGKSTLVDLMIGFYSPQSGKILINGKDLSEIDMKSWLRQIGLISQETFIFNTSIEKNISFAVADSEVNKEKVVEAAKIADLHSFVIGLPEGYKTVVGERGLKLSGGQRQRLAIARAAYRDPELYIFDEATSSLDTYSERKIQESIENLSQSKTVIAIAHRFSTVINADEIIVIKDGKIIEKGNHSDLLNKSGFYAELYANQNRENTTKH